MKPVPTDQEVFDQADGIAAAMLDLSDLIAGRLDRAAKAHAQERFRLLKAKLDEVCRAGQAIERERAMTPAERGFYWAVREARATISARWNSDPRNSRWGDQLYSARFDITYFLTNARVSRNRNPATGVPV